MANSEKALNSIVNLLVSIAESLKSISRKLDTQNSKGK